VIVTSSFGLSTKAVISGRGVELIDLVKIHFSANKQGQAAVARANHKIKETRFRELPPSKGIKSFCS
jgi:hypothetical protein